MNFDTTQNLFIEGDNLEVLKLLQEAHLGQIKVIYIDPPYNTGKDSIYKDNFIAAKEVFERAAGNGTTRETASFRIRTAEGDTIPIGCQ